MWRTLILARLGGWICLLGSVLSLVAFFLPYRGSPPESLGHILMRVYLSVFSNQPTHTLYGMTAVNAGAMVVVLPGNVFMACAALLSGSYQRGSLPTALKFPGLTLLCYFVVSLITFSVAWLDAQDANQPAKALAFIDTLTKLSIGAWLIPLGLLLALLGGMLVWRGERKADT